MNANLSPSSVLGVLEALERSITYCVHRLIKLKLVVRIIRLIVRVQVVARCVKYLWTITLVCTFPLSLVG
jgi:hypothetical protein